MIFAQLGCYDDDFCEDYCHIKGNCSTVVQSNETKERICVLLNKKNYYDKCFEACQQTVDSIDEEYFEEAEEYIECLEDEVDKIGACDTTKLTAARIFCITEDTFEVQAYFSLFDHLFEKLFGSDEDYLKCYED